MGRLACARGGSGLGAAALAAGSARAQRRCARGVPPAARGPPGLPGARRRRRRRHRGVVGLGAALGPRPSGARGRGGVGGRRPPAQSGRRSRARADGTGAPGRRANVGPLPAAVEAHRLGRCADALAAPASGAAAPRQCPARHAAGGLLAGRHDRVGGDDAPDRHRRGRPRVIPGRGGTNAAERGACPAAGVRRASRRDRRGDLRQGHAGPPQRARALVACAHPAGGVRTRGQDTRPPAPRLSAGAEPPRDRGGRVRGHGRAGDAGRHPRRDRGRDSRRVRHRRGGADPGAGRRRVAGPGRDRARRARGGPGPSVRAAGCEHRRWPGAGRVRPGAADRRDARARRIPAHRRADRAAGPEEE